MSFTFSRHSTTKMKQKLMESDRIELLREILQPSNFKAEKIPHAVSSHWKNFLPTMNIHERNGRFIVRSQGVANLTKLNLWNTFRFGLGSLRCGLHYLKIMAISEYFLKS